MGRLKSIGVKSVFVFLLVLVLCYATPVAARPVSWMVSLRPLMHPGDILAEMIYSIAWPYLCGDRDDPDFTKARAILRVGVHLYPASPVCYFGLARISKYLGQVDAAIDYYRTCIELSVRPAVHRWVEVSALINLGYLYLERKKDMTAARNAFYQALVLEPTNRRVLNALRRWDEARIDAARHPRIDR